MSESLPLYGRQSRQRLQGYRPITPETHVRGYVRAMQGRGPWYDEVLVEEHQDGTVTLLPSDACSYGFRQYWRRAHE